VSALQGMNDHKGLVDSLWAHVLAVGPKDNYILLTLTFKVAHPNAIPVNKVVLHHFKSS
jgi:hypothetical protein